LRQLSPGRCQPTQCSSRRLVRPFRVSSRGPTVGPPRVATGFRRAAHATSGRQPSWAFLPYSAFGTGDPLTAGVASPATVRPQRFSRSRRFTPPGTSPGLFHPGNAPGLFPDLQGLLPPEELVPSRGLLLSCRSPKPRAGEGPRDRLGFRGFFSSGIRAFERIFRPVRRPIPSWSFLLQGPLFRHRRIGFPTRPLVRFATP